MIRSSRHPVGTQMLPRWHPVVLSCSLAEHDFIVALAVNLLHGETLLLHDDAQLDIFFCFSFSISQILRTFADALGYAAWLVQELLQQTSVGTTENGYVLFVTVTSFYMEDQKDIIIYRTADGRASVALYAKDGKIWLNQQQMAELFATSKQTISHHIINILKEKELNEISVVKQYLTTAADGKNYNVVFYPLIQ